MTTFVSLCLAYGFAVLAIALAACLARIVRGPTLADRVLAVDLSTIAGAGLMAVIGVTFDDTVFLDIALILIVTSFVGTAAFAQFIERQQRRDARARVEEEHATTGGDR